MVSEPPVLPKCPTRRLIMTIFCFCWRGTLCYLCQPEKVYFCPPATSCCCCCQLERLAEGSAWIAKAIWTKQINITDNVCNSQSVFRAYTIMLNRTILDLSMTKGKKMNTVPHSYWTLTKRCAVVGDIDIWMGLASLCAAAKLLFRVLRLRAGVRTTTYGKDSTFRLQKSSIQYRCGQVSIKQTGIHWYCQVFSALMKAKITNHVQRKIAMQTFNNT